MIPTQESGIVKFRNQRDIIADRQQKTAQKYQALQKRVGRIILINNHLAQATNNEQVKEK